MLILGHKNLRMIRKVGERLCRTSKYYQCDVENNLIKGSSTVTIISNRTKTFRNKKTMISSLKRGLREEICVKPNVNAECVIFLVKAKVYASLKNLQYLSVCSFGSAEWWSEWCWMQLYPPEPPDYFLVFFVVPVVILALSSTPSTFSGLSQTRRFTSMLLPVQDFLKTRAEIFFQDISKLTAILHKFLALKSVNIAARQK